MNVLIGRRAAETWPIDRLRRYERNSRRHSAEQIAASIRQWGLPCWRLNRLRVSRLREARNRWMPGSEFIAEAQMNALRKMMESVDVDQHRPFCCFALDAARSGIGDR